ncbi:hypothetical protein TWF481_003230 [Arthrobotrys musiformis]|uniref:Uncharacterized protein n=1 Tax=Arthrobotrys musiformis TaxID=47236 RepID=A0AAV9VPS4_9PEZI
MAYENVDAADMRHYLSAQERQFPAHAAARGFHQENSSPDSMAKGSSATETALRLERDFTRNRTEIRSSQIPQSENAIFKYRERESEGTTGSITTLGKSEAQVANIRISRILDNTEKEHHDPRTQGFPREYSNTSEDEDPDLDDEADKIAFHKREIARLSARVPPDITLLLVHLKALIETYKVFDDSRALLVLSTFYLQGTTASGPNLEETRKCLSILANFKPSNLSIATDIDADAELRRAQESIGIYLIRAMANFQLQNYPSAYKDSRRTISLGKKLPADSLDRWRLYVQSAFEIAAESSKFMGDEGNMLYYRSLCGENETRAFVVVSLSIESTTRTAVETKYLPTISQLGQELPRTANLAIARAPEEPHKSNQVINSTAPKRQPIRNEQSEHAEYQQRDRPPKNREYTTSANNLTIQTPRTPSSHLTENVAVEQEANTDLDNRLERLSLPEKRVDFRFIIPPSLPNPIAIRSYTLGSEPNSRDAAVYDSNLIRDPILATFKSHVNIGFNAVWVDLINLNGQHIRGAMKLNFGSYENIMTACSTCLKKNQPNIASAILKNGKLGCVPTRVILYLSEIYQLNISRFNKKGFTTSEGSGSKLDMVISSASSLGLRLMEGELKTGSTF